MSKTVMEKLDVTKQKGFRIEYCHIRKEYVAILAGSGCMGYGKTIQMAIKRLTQDVAKNNPDQEPEEI